MFSNHVTLVEEASATNLGERSRHPCDKKERSRKQFRNARLTKHILLIWGKKADMQKHNYIWKEYNIFFKLSISIY